VRGRSSSGVFDAGLSARAREEKEEDSFVGVEGPLLSVPLAERFPKEIIL
jgi:hypothetical protein